MNEFDMIKHYFNTQTMHRDDVVLGIGDDAAIVNVPKDHELVVTTDTLVEGIHFPVETLPYDMGYKALAVNLSDIAAMGANPAWVTLALTLREAQSVWLQDFCSGFFTLANRSNVQLIGGDITHGPISITVQAMGLVPKGQAILRSGAKEGDLIYVTGHIGDAGLALAHLQNKTKVDTVYHPLIVNQLHRPEPRLATGLALRGLASALIDISDGLAADLGHILEQSKVGAKINVDQIPLSAALTNTLSHDEAIQLALTAGDDYELCFTIPQHQRAELEHRLASIACRYTCIGQITATLGLKLYDQNGIEFNGPTTGYKHF